MNAPQAPAPSRFRTVTATLGLFVLVIPVTLVLAAVAIFVTLIRGSWFFAVARLWSRFLLGVLGVTVEAEIDPALAERAREVNAGGAVGLVLVANHQSYMDIPAVFATMPVPVVFATKAELFRIPVFGSALKAGGFIPVYRGDRSRGKLVFDAAARRLEEGGSLLFFPEGTRTRDGRIGKFRRGAFIAAQAADAAVVPVGIDGALDILHRDRLVVRPGTIRLRYGAPVESRAYEGAERQAFQEDLRERVMDLTGLPPAPVVPSPTPWKNSSNSASGKP